jgi:tetratricopeptide (TPR) repeat protein
MDTTTAGLAAAQLHQQAGDLDSARQEYSRLLEAEPDRVEALHGLGGIAYQQGDHHLAVEWLGRAVAVQPDNALLHSNLGAAQRAAGRLAEAEACYRQALRLQPDLAQAYNNLANVLKEQGKGEEAAARYWQAVLASPIYAEARHNLGLILWEQGEPEAALDQFRFAAQLRPDFAEAHASAGLLLRELGRPEEAGARLREAVRLRPDGAKDHFNLAAILLEQGHAGEAASHFSEAVRLRPDWAEAHRALGVALAALGRPGESAALLGLSRRLQSTGPSGALPPAPAVAAPNGAAREPAPEAADALTSVAFESLRKMKPEEAEAQCREALGLKPDRPRALDALGAALAKQGRLTEALTAYHHAIRVEPAFAEAYLHLGGALREQGELGRAVGYFRHALRLRPGLVEAHHQLGLAFVDQGDLEAAADAYREALRLQPDSVFALGHLGSLLEELGEGEKGAELLQRALRLGPDEWQTHTHYGASLVNLGRFEEARTHFLRALDLHPGCGPAWFYLARDGGQPLSDADVAYLQALLQREHLLPRDRISVHFALGRVHDRARECDEAFHHCEQGNACKARLLELRGTAYQEEVHARLVDRIIAAFGPAYFERTRSFGVPAEEPVFIVGMPRSGTSLVEQILASHPAVHGAGELRLMQQFVDGLPVELGGASAYPDCMAGLDAEASRRLGEAYVEKLRRLGGGKARITDKMPMNFHHLGVMATLLPQAPIIHCRRDARDVCWSCHFQNFRDIAFACDLRKLGAYYRQYERIMAHWRAVLPVPVLEVQYEELVAEPERVSREIVAFCRLPWHEGCLDFHHTQRVVRTASNMQVRRPVYRSSVGYWRNYEKHLGPLLEALAPKAGE